MATQAQREATKRYLEKQDQHTLRLPGGSKEKIRAHANEVGAKSMNAYIVSLIEKDMGPLEEPEA